MDFTTHIQLPKPAPGEEGWAPYWDAGMDRLDAIAGTAVDNVVNIMQAPYNCVGDGVTDNATGLAAAFAAAAGKTIYIPPGDFVTSGVIVLTGDNVRVVGAGWELSTIRKKDNSTLNPLLILSCKNFIMEDLTLDWGWPNQSSQASSTVVVPSWAAHKGPTVFRRVFCRNPPSATIALDGVTDVLIEGCWFQGNGTEQASKGITVGGNTRNVTIRNNVFRYMNQGITVTGTNNRNVVIDGNDMDFGWWFLQTYDGLTNSGGTVTYTAGALIDTAANFPDFGSNARYVRAMPVLASGSTVTYDNTTITDATKDFAAAGVLRGHIVRVAGKFAIVDTVGTTTMEVEGWLDSSTYELVARPDANTAYTVYGCILGRSNTNTATQINVYSAWKGMDGNTATTPAAGTMYEVIEKNNYLVHVVAGNPGVRVSNNNCRRSFSDFFEMQSDDCQVVNNTLYGGQDIGIALVGHRGMAVGNRVDFMGAMGIYVAGLGGMVVGNTVADCFWINTANQNARGEIFVEASSTGAVVVGNSCLITGLYNILNDGYGIAVQGGETGFPVTNVLVEGNICSGHSIAGIRLYGAGGNSNSVHLGKNSATVSMAGTWSFLGQEMAGGGVTTKTKAGAPTDSDTELDADGTIVLDTTNHRLYVRSGGVWKYAALT